MTRVRLRSEGVAHSDVGGEIVVLDLRTSQYFSAKGSAARILSRLTTGAGVEDLVSDLVGEYEVDYDVARSDVESFLDDLRKRDLIEDVDA